MEEPLVVASAAPGQDRQVIQLDEHGNSQAIKTKINAVVPRLDLLERPVNATEKHSSAGGECRNRRPDELCPTAEIQERMRIRSAFQHDEIQTTIVDKTPKINHARPAAKGASGNDFLQKHRLRKNSRHRLPWPQQPDAAGLAAKARLQDERLVRAGSLDPTNGIPIVD